MKENNLIILSHIINIKTPTYGNRDHFYEENLSQISTGASANSSKWIFSTNHLGTHIDVPKHFFDDGMTLTDYPISFWYSDKAQLIDIPLENAVLISKELLYGKINNNTEVLLLRTGYEKYRDIDKYWNDNPGISEEVGFWLRCEFPNIKIIGFDFISLTSLKYREEGKKAHKAFLNPQGVGNPICIIEDMSLYEINGNISEIYFLPLMVERANGSPLTIFCKITQEK
jgi:kynurenine formamidase